MDWNKITEGVLESKVQVLWIVPIIYLALMGGSLPVLRRFSSTWNAKREAPDRVMDATWIMFLWLTSPIWFGLYLIGSKVIAKPLMFGTRRVEKLFSVNREESQNGVS